MNSSSFLWGMGGQDKPPAAAAPIDAVTHPRQLRGGGAAQGVRAGRGVGRDRRGGRAGSGLHHDVPVVASGFALEVVIIAIVLSQIKLVRDAPYTGDRRVDVVGAIFSVFAMGGIVLSILVWQEGGEAVGALLVVGAVAMALLIWWLARRKREGKPALIDAGLFASKIFRLGISGQMVQQISLGGLMIALPIFLQMVLEYSAMGSGLSIAPLSLSMFAVALLAGKRAGARRPSSIIRAGFLLLTVGIAALLPIVPRADSGWALVDPAGRRGVRPGAPGVAAQQLHAVPDLRGARERGRGREFSCGLVRALVRARIRGRDHARDALAQVHRPGGVEHRARAGRAAAGRTAWRMTPN